MFENKITVGKLTTNEGGFIQINNLLVEVKVSSDNLGYIVDVFDNDSEELLNTSTIWKEDLANEEE